MDIKLSQQIEMAAWDIFIDSVSQSEFVKKLTRFTVQIIENNKFLFVFRAFLVISLTLLFALLAGLVISTLPL